MDTKSLARHFAHLIVVVTIIIQLAIPRPALAQSGTCPDYTDPIIPIPTGYFPQTMAACVELNDFDVSVDYSAEYPCNSALVIGPTLSSMLDEWPETFFVYPTNQAFPSGFARMRFEVHGETLIGTNSNVVIQLRSYTPGSSVIYTTNINAEDYPSVLSGFGHRWYLIDVTFPAEQDGMVSLQVMQPSPITMEGVFYASLQIQDSTDVLPPLCQIPGGTLPTPTFTPAPTHTPTRTPTPTPSDTPTGVYNTPTPSQTPNPSHTPTNTRTPQSFPTAPGGTFTPLPTKTPLVIITIPAENTPTPWPAITLPTLQIPHIDIPSVGDIDTPAPISVGLTPNATTVAIQGEIATWVASSGIVATRWHTATLWGGNSLSTTITNTTGISSPVAIAGVLSTSIITPIAYAKSIQLYMPNLWPMVFFLILATAWIFFNLIAKFGIAIGSELLELLYKTWEAIPFN